MHLIEIISTISSIIALVSLLIVVAKLVTKRLNKKGFIFFKSADKNLMNIHKSAAKALIFSGALHGILSFSKFTELGIRPYILGTVCLLSCLASAGSFYIIKKHKVKKQWLVYHRIFATIALITFIVHIALSR